MKLKKYSLGIGDRFAHQGKAQLSAIIQAKEAGVDITPVWNKSYREHQIIGSKPADTRRAADAAVKATGWRDPYFVDADHIGMKNVDFFLDSSDFFTIDVADFIGKPAAESKVDTLAKQLSRYVGSWSIPGIDEKVTVNKEQVKKIVGKYLLAIEEASTIYNHILSQKQGESFAVEVSMDETSSSQTPVELFFILAGLAHRGIPLNTIAPKFSGEFNKGIDYIGNIDQFTREFEQDVAVVQFAVGEFKLPADLKLSVHSGSDKFSIYQPMHRILKKFDAGVHLKTAGTTWLEELIGLAEAGGEGLALAREIYKEALNRYDELVAPYLSVIHIITGQLPTAKEVEKWDEEAFTSALRHDQDNPYFNLHFRQLLHVGYKIAAAMGDRYLRLLRKNENVIAKNVSENIFERHIKPIFMD
ncbi:hypothetical protein JXO59_06200 [candidate division KSB1 bacterium]|nr:hypothetical protein [candidate division KSB1 bacterium]